MRIVAVVMGLLVAGAVQAQDRPETYEDLVAAVQAFRAAEQSRSQAEEEALLQQAKGLLDGIVAAEPDGVVAAQLRTGGVPVVGGPDLSLAVVDGRLRHLCLRYPTVDCLCDAALATILGIVDPVERNRELEQSVWRLGDPGCLDQAGAAVAAIDDAALAEAARRALARQFAEAKHFDEALAIAAQLETERMELEMSIAWQQLDAGDVAGAEATLESLGARRLEPGQAGRVGDVALLVASQKAADERRFTDAWSQAYGIVAPSIFIDASIKIAEGQAAAGDLDAATRTLVDVRAATGELDGLRRSHALLALARLYGELGDRAQLADVVAEIFATEADIEWFQAQEIALLQADFGFFDEARRTIDQVRYDGALRLRTLVSIAEKMAEQDDLDGAQDVLRAAFQTETAGAHNEWEVAEIVLGQAKLGMIDEAGINAEDLSDWSRLRVHLAISEAMAKAGETAPAHRMIEDLIDEVADLPAASSRTRMLAMIAHTQQLIGMEDAAAATLRRATSLIPQMETPRAQAFELTVIARDMASW